MKQYKVLKDLINAPVGTILSDGDNGLNTLYLSPNEFHLGRIVDHTQFNNAIEQGFIEPYTQEPKHWRAENGCRFFIVNEYGDASERVDWRELYSTTLHKSGAYYRTEATAELVAKAQKLFFEWLHDKEATKATAALFAGTTDNLMLAMDEAREAVLEDDSNE